MVKKSLRKVFLIDCEVYPFDVLISIGENDKHFLNTVSKKLPARAFEELKQADNMMTFSPTTQARTMMFSTGQFIIRFRKFPTTCEELGMVNHEIFHIVDMLFRKIGMPLRKESSEAYAYLIGYLTTKFLENIR
jgi:hypothetical protein